MSQLKKTFQLPDAALELVAGRFKVLSEPFRLKLILALKEGEKNVGQLVAATGATQTNVSRQLQVLADAGIACRRKVGVSVYYNICDPAIYELCEHVCGSLQKQLASQAATSKLFAPKRS